MLKNKYYKLSILGILIIFTCIIYKSQSFLHYYIRLEEFSHKYDKYNQTYTIIGKAHEIISSNKNSIIFTIKEKEYIVKIKYTSSCLTSILSAINIF
ncbi:MAG: hypothetical protein AAFO15_02780 [Pseudomonadota bacterium]